MRLNRQSQRQALRPFAGRGATAFTVTELMLAVAIMGVIVFSLYSVFNQTQKALRNTQTQGDVSEKARAIVDIISRELQQAHPTFSSVTVSNIPIPELNFVGGFSFPSRVQKTDRTDIQARTNYLQALFFYTHHTNAWQGIGYRVINVTNGVGSLVRFETNHFGSKPSMNQLPLAFQSESRTNTTYHHIANGVIHLAFIPYDANGFRLGYDTTNRGVGNYKICRLDVANKPITKWSDVTQTNLASIVLRQADPSVLPGVPYATSFAFQSNAVPAYLDMEFGILEPETLSQYYTMLDDNNPNAANFLAKQVTKVHLYRQRIPIRTAAQ